VTDHPDAGSCELPNEGVPTDRSPHHPFRRGPFAWDGIPSGVYKTGEGSGTEMAWQGVARHTLAGAGSEPMAFELRYFEIAPRGYSSLEKHQHVHSIVVLQGTGHVVIGSEVFTVSPFDLVYVPSGVPHQFVNDGAEPFGFLCPVDADRDHPQPLTEAELRDFLADPRVRDAVRGQRVLSEESHGRTTRAAG